MFPMYAYAIQLRHWTISRFFRCGPPGKGETKNPTGHTEGTSGVVPEQPIRSLRAAEHAAVGLSADDTDLNALSWLFEFSFSPSVRNIVVHSLSALPLRSVTSLKLQLESPTHQSTDSLMSRLDDNALVSIIDELLDTLRYDDNSALRVARELSRYIRIHIRFTTMATLAFSMSSTENRLPRGTYAALHSVNPFDHTTVDSLSKTVIAGLTDSRWHEPQLFLQPIVWASILRRLHPLDSRINVSLLLNEIPTSFWHPQSPPPPLVFTSAAFRQIGRLIEPEMASIPAELKISSHSTEVDEPVPLYTAIHTCLYHYVFETIIQGHEDIRNVQGSIDDLSPMNESPQDPKLCFLLKMASTPSLWDMSGATFGEHNIYRYSYSFIRRILLNIGVYLDVHKFSLIDKNIPSFSLDVDRQAVLKLLYKMISSTEFGNGPLRVEYCRVVLIIFLRVLNSTSPRPPFLPKDWCTPELAANSARLAFEGYE